MMRTNHHYQSARTVNLALPIICLILVFLTATALLI